jgi:hypothetical protein
MKNAVFWGKNHLFFNINNNSLALATNKHYGESSLRILNEFQSKYVLELLYINSNEILVIRSNKAVLLFELHVIAFGCLV